MCVQCHGTDFLSCCADDESDGLKEKHHPFLAKRKQQEESTRQNNEENRQRASAKKDIKLIKKARERDDRMQGNVHPQEQAAMKTHNKSLEEKKQASLTAFFGPCQTNEDSGDTKMPPLKSTVVAHPVIELFLARCLWPSHWKINTFFLSVMLSSSLSSPPPCARSCHNDEYLPLACVC